MNLNRNKITSENKQYYLESVKQAKQYVKQGKLSTEDLQTLIKISPQPKYVGWLAKIWIKEEPDIDDLRNYIEEYDTFAKKGKAKTKDIFQFKSFKDLKNEVDDINQSGEGVSTKDLESDYDVVVDNEDLYIASPHTHEASRKLGLSQFAFRDCGDGAKDSAWCTTYKAPDHFNSYYYSRNVTFYYIKVKSNRLMKELEKAFPDKWKQLVVSAIAVLEDGRIDMYDGLDKQQSPSNIKKFTDIIGIS
jgi:hypothetical protein